jgi:hypothetical protein
MYYWQARDCSVDSSGESFSLPGSQHPWCYLAFSSTTPSLPSLLHSFLACVSYVFEFEFLFSLRTPVIGFGTQPNPV